MKILLLTISMVFLIGCSSAEIGALENEITHLTSDINGYEIEADVQKKEISDLKDEKNEFELQVKKLEAAIVELENEKDLPSDTKMMSTSLLSVALSIMDDIAAQDFLSVSTYVDPILGLRFSPYSYIDFSSDLWFSPSQVANLMSDPLVYTWGNYDGSGDPITTNFIGYYNEFVYDETYDSPHMIGNNTLIGSGNMINNLNTLYPTASFVEFHFTGFNPAFDGMDWTSIRLIFEYVSGSWKLIGIGHDNWTS